MCFIATGAPLLFVAALVWLWGVRGEGSQREEDRLAVARAVAAAALALALGQVIGWIYVRPRPFMAHPVHLLIPPLSDPSFPSDHALAAFAIAGALAWTHRRLGAGLGALGILLAFARVFVGTHYPLDVIGGAVLGGAVGGMIRKADGGVRPLGTLAARCTDTISDRLTRVRRTKG